MARGQNTRRARKLTPDPPRIVFHDAPVEFHDRRTRHRRPGSSDLEDEENHQQHGIAVKKERSAVDEVAASVPNNAAPAPASASAPVPTTHVSAPELEQATTAMRESSSRGGLAVCIPAAGGCFVFALVVLVVRLVFRMDRDGVRVRNGGARLPRPRRRGRKREGDVEGGGGNTTAITGLWDQDAARQRNAPLAVLRG